MRFLFFRRKDTTPMGEELDRELLEDNVRAATNSKGPCHATALRLCYKYQKKGIRYKLCHGTYRGENHKWVEYFDERQEQWLIDDPAQDIYGWYRGRCPDYKCTLETVPEYRKDTTWLIMAKKHIG